MEGNSMNNGNIDYKTLAAELLDIQKQEEEQKKRNSNWKDLLERNSKGNIICNINNYLLFLENHKEYKGKLKYNEFLCQKEYNGEEFTDFALNNIYVKCEQETTLGSHAKIDTALSHVFDKNRYNPILNYLNEVVWDGKERIGRLFIDLLDADDTQLTYKLTKKWFIAAVKRVFEPGCKFDNMLVLQGAGGIGKSTICSIISKSFSNNVSLGEVGNKDLVDKLNKTWIAIIEELDKFNSKEMSTIKAFLSLDSDTVRLSYARNSQTFKRHCVFIGSTNDETFLRDTTSPVERRFWIIKCNKKTMNGDVRNALTDEFVNQLWAEAVHYYKENPNQYLDVEMELQDEFAETQRDFKTFNDDVAIDYIKEILYKDYTLYNGCFKDLNDFSTQFKSGDYYEGAKEKLTKVPMSWVIHVLKDNFHMDKSSKYIAAAFSKEWDYKVIRYGDKVFKGLSYKNSDEERKNAELLPF